MFCSAEVLSKVLTLQCFTVSVMVRLRVLVDRGHVDGHGVVVVVQARLG